MHVYEYFPHVYVFEKVAVYDCRRGLMPGSAVVVLLPRRHLFLGLSLLFVSLFAPFPLPPFTSNKLLYLSCCGCFLFKGQGAKGAGR